MTILGTILVVLGACTFVVYLFRGEGYQPAPLTNAALGLVRVFALLELLLFIAVAKGF